MSLLARLRLTKFLILLLFIFGAPGGALASSLTVVDNTWMQPWIGGQAASSGWNWTDTPIASDPSAWQINKTTINWSAGGNLQMQIFTNYPQAGADNGLAGQADIGLDLNHDGVFEYGIKMSGPDLGKLYSVTSWKTAQDLWGDGSWVYTGRYDTNGSTANPNVPYTLINTGSVVGQGTVTWEAAPADSGSAWVVDVLLPEGINSTGNWNNFDFTVASGTCANEIMAGTAFNPDYPVGSNNPVPLPPSVLLLASGLLALTMLSLRRKAGSVKRYLRR